MKTYLLIIVFVITAAIALADEVMVVYDHSTGTYSAQPVNQLVTPGQDPGAERFAQLQKQLSSAQTALANLSVKMRDNGHDQRYKRRIKQIKAEMKSLGYNGTGVPAPIRTGGGIYTPKYTEPPISSFTTPGRTAPAHITP
jgi:TolA-binding protein